MPYGKLPTLQWTISRLGHVQRYFRRNEGSTDYATIPEVTLTGDFVFTVDILNSVTSTAGEFVFAARNSASGSYGLNLYSFGDWATGTGKLTLFGLSGTHVITGLSADKFYSIKVTYTASTGVVEMYCNNVLEHTGISSHPIGLATADTMAVYDTPQRGFKFSGIVANLKIYDNGTLVRDYPINDGKNILANAATALGNEIDGLTYALTTAIGGVASVVLSSLSVIGKTYLVEVSYSGVVGDASVRIGGFSGPSFTGTGTIEFVATATTTVNDILGALTGVTSGSVTVSIKEAEGYGTIINGNADDWGLFDKQADGDWKGNGLSVPPWDSVDQVLVTA